MLSKLWIKHYASNIHFSLPRKQSTGYLVEVIISKLNVYAFHERSTINIICLDVFLSSGISLNIRTNNEKLFPLVPNYNL